jgi:hypothetical protein
MSDVFPRRSKTINQFCAKHQYSRPHWYRLKARGEAPDTIGEGRATRITAEAEDRWVEQQEAKARRSA